MKKVKRIIFELEDQKHAIWTPESLEDKYAANYICEALHTADNNGGVDAMVLGIKSKKNTANCSASTGLVGSPTYITLLLNRLLNQMIETTNAALKSSGKEEKS